MRKALAISLTLLILTVALSGCFPPLAEQKVTVKNGSVSGDVSTDGKDERPSFERTIYVSGAVLNDGVISVPEVCDYKTLWEIAGIGEFSAVENNAGVLINVGITEYYLDFIFDGEVCSSINVNGALICNRMEIFGVSKTVVDKLADYIELNGKIANREQLRVALGSDYADNYYKFYIDRPDYA